ncbi:MAG: tetratricopeptide repeat protein, partial [Candidatus Rokubacteria bacterium]|nr:tetratricopeptide repeat protein [Candidatus Rokubacteria bacterium]
MIRRAVRKAISVLVAAAAAAAQGARPPTPEEAADKVAAAFQANDDLALRALSGSDDPDPWFVADELCGRGDHDAAEAFARAAPGKDTEALPAYVTSRRGTKDDPDARRALAAANEALRTGKWAAALAIFDGVKATTSGVVAIRLDHGRGFALRGLRRLDESAAAFLRAAEAADRVGWLGGAADALDEGGESAYSRSDYRTALSCWERGLAIEETRPGRGGVARTLGNIGNAHLSLGHYPTALPYFERMLELMEESGDRAGAAAALGSLGNVHRALGSYTEALSCNERALKIVEDLGQQGGVAIAL